MAGVSEAGRRTVSILVLGMLVSLAAGGTAFAQAGSTGGTIGKIDKSVSGGEEGATREPRAKSHATHRASAGPRSEARSGSAGLVGGVGNTQLPSAVDAYDFGQQWRDRRRRRDRASFASWCCQGKRSCPWAQIRFRRSLSRRTSVRDSCRSERLPRTLDGDKVMIACRVSGSDHRHAVKLDHCCRLDEA